MGVVERRFGLTTAGMNEWTNEGMNGRGGGDEWVRRRR